MSRCPIVPLPPFLPWQNGPKKICQECQTRFHSSTPWAEPIWKSMNLPWSGRYWDSGPSVKLSHLHPTYPDLFEWEILCIQDATNKHPNPRTWPIILQSPATTLTVPREYKGGEPRREGNHFKSPEVGDIWWHDLFWCGNQELYCIWSVAYFILDINFDFECTTISGCPSVGELRCLLGQAEGYPRNWHAAVKSTNQTSLKFLYLPTGHRPILGVFFLPHFLQLGLRLPPCTLESTVHSGRQIGAWLARPWV